MKRDWDVIREVLTEIETAPSSERTNLTYGVGPEYPTEGASKGEHALLLWKAGFISAIDITTYGGHAILSPELTWQPGFDSDLQISPLFGGPLQRRRGFEGGDRKSAVVARL